MRIGVGMALEEIIAQVQNIFVDVLDEDVEIANETTANDIEEWDSLTHIQLIVAIEKHFRIKFTSTEIQGFKNVGEMCVSITQKIS